MATIWIAIVDMGGNPSKMENAGTPPPKNNAPKNNAPKNNGAPKNNAPKNNAPKNNAPKNNAPKNNAPKNNGQRNNGASSPHLPEEEEEPDLEANVGNVSVTGTVGSNNRSRSPSNANAVEPEVNALEVNTPPTGGRRRSRKHRKGRKSRRSKRSY